MIFGLVVAQLLVPQIALAATPQARPSYNFNAGWKVLPTDAPEAQAVAFDDSKWKPVTLPHGFNEDEAFKKDIVDLTNGIAWYRKTFRLPADVAGKKCLIEFQGVRHAGEVFLNGKSVGYHENGVMAFGIDLTENVLPAPQDNVIAVRTDSSWAYKERATGSGYQWADRNFNANYGGINKNVILHFTDKLHQTLPLFLNLGTTGVYVYAKDFDIPGRAATITAESEVRNERSAPVQAVYSTVIADADGKVVGTFTQQPVTIAPGQTTTLTTSGRVEGLNFWSWGYGYLYDVYTTVAVDGKPVDVVRTRTGFRKAEFTKGLVKLNDRTIQFKGYAQRTSNEWPALGINLPPWVSDFSNHLMVESNANLVRWMHITPSKQDVESCDRVGMIQAMPAGDSERDPDGRRWEMRVELMRDAVIYNRNNPSIIFYEAGNAGISEPHMKDMLDIRIKYDPHGGRAMGSREMLDSKIAEWGGEMLYINKSRGKPLWATEYSRDEALRKYMDEFTPPYHKNGDGPPHRNQPAPSYNRNQDTHAVEDVQRWYDWWRERPGTGDRVSAGGVNIIFSDTNTHHRGSTNYRTSGEVDAMRLPKEGFFAHKVMWDGWVDTERYAAHIIGHWNYAPGTKKPINVVSSAEKVELFVNGVSKGVGEQNYRFLYTFPNIQWESGSIRAVGYDATGKQVCEAELKTAGAPASVRLTPHIGPGGLRADGSDLVLLDVEVVDANGQRVPTAFNEIKFDVTGPGEYRGGIAVGPDNYIMANPLPVELGINRVIVRSKTEAGKIQVTAASEGLKPATIQLTSYPSPHVHGLSVNFPSDGVPSRLDRGPTPAGDSVKIWRKSVRVAKVTAGSNPDQAAESFDDNERTGWSSDTNINNSWIRYEFEQPTQVSEIAMRLDGWRTRTYTLQIMVDDQEVFSGTTPRSLGYVTLPLKPATGKNLTVKLAGAGRDRDGFGNIIELGTAATRPVTTRDADAEGRASRGILRILEAEIYTTGEAAK
ncbi:MAG: DUF4982 domain-containing protein [Burkholderiales bacterium]|nr:DUF4982 domain-containing protein [Phycisphaerae bacterium]